jgi:hypothetical protein
MTTPRIDELRRLESEATPGPWQAEGGAVTGLPDPEGEYHAVVTRSAVIWSEDEHEAKDAALIAAARNALPLLLEVVEAAQRVVAHDPHFRPSAPPEAGSVGHVYQSLLDALDGVASAGEDKRL